MGFGLLVHTHACGRATAHAVQGVDYKNNGTKKRNLTIRFLEYF